MKADEVLTKIYNRKSDSIDTSLQDQTSLPLSIYFTDNDVIEPVVTAVC